jgi:predicted small secreted protein
MRWFFAAPCSRWEPNMSNQRKHISGESRSGTRRTAGALLTLFVAAGAVTLLSACNTTSGVGKDVSATGRAVTGAAERAKGGL